MKNNITIVVIGVVKKGNKYLLTFRDEKDQNYSWANKHWQLPGGGMEYGETPEQTVIREMKEELGITVIKTKLIPKLITKFRSNWQGLFISYLCEYNEKDKITINNEASQYGWFTINEIKKLKILPGLLEILDPLK